MSLPYSVVVFVNVGSIPVGEEHGEADSLDTLPDVTANLVANAVRRFEGQVGVSFVVRSSPLKGRNLAYHLRRDGAESVRRLVGAS